MNLKSKHIVALTCTLLMSASCIKNEPLNKEADIEFFGIEGNTYVNTIQSEDNRTIKVIVTESADLTHLTPLFTLSAGATASPASGVVQDFSANKEILYTITSEDGIYHKIYKVRAAPASVSLRYDFEDWEMGGSPFKFPILSDTEWSSGNQGVALATLGKASEYPTHSTTDSYSGEYALELKTLEGKPKLAPDVLIYAGSMFRGKFNANPSNPLKSLFLGHKHLRVSGKPYKFEGYYKYKPGDVFKDKNNNVVSGKTDEFSAYAIIFRVSKGVDGNDEYLDGETVFTSNRIIARAQITDTSAKDKYTHFSIPFHYTAEMDYNIYDYKLTIVFSSSKDGDLYEGAIGSTLIVDEVEIICTPLE